MNNNLLKLAPWLFAAIGAWCLGFAYNVGYGGGLSWVRMMYENKKTIAASIQNEPRLIIAGGSGAHYSINAKELEKDLGMSVVNFGLDGPIGLNVILPTILEQVRQGDTVLLIPEYLILLDEDGLGDRSTGFGIAIGKPMLGDIPPKQFFQDTLALGIPSLKPLSKSMVDLVEKGQFTDYYSDPLNDRGDPTEFKKRTGRWWKLPINQPISEHSFNRIYQFKREVEAKGGKLILSLPWVYADRSEKTIGNVRKTAARLEKIAPLVYDTSNLNLQSDSNLFADTQYHLIPEARLIRAKQLAKELKPILENSKVGDNRR
jgi:hypothetical protein